MIEEFGASLATVVISIQQREGCGVNPLNAVLVCLLASALIGCGTIDTVLRGDSVVRQNLNHAKSPCAIIPRVYSGVIYDICLLRGKPSRTTLWLGPGPEWMLIDVALSGALDTVALPYTIFEQIDQGSVELR